VILNFGGSKASLYRDLRFRHSIASNVGCSTSPSRLIVARCIVVARANGSCSPNIREGTEEVHRRLSVLGFRGGA